jgi:hypothetical protein
MQNKLFKRVLEVDLTFRQGLTREDADEISRREELSTPGTSSPLVY